MGERAQAVGELDGERLALGQPLLLERRQPVLAQALLRERGKLVGERAGGVAAPARRARPARPARCARPPRAPTARPVRIRSSARPRPISRGSRTVPPSISGTPKRRQKTPSTASRSATRRSHHSASSSPPATAWPLIAAITGLDEPHPGRSHRTVAVGGDAVAVRAADRVQVRARAERPARSPQDGDRRLGIRVERAERIGERRGGRPVDGVAPLRPVEDHGRHRPVALTRTASADIAPPRSVRGARRLGARTRAATRRPPLARASGSRARAGRRAPPRTRRRRPRR